MIKKTIKTVIFLAMALFLVACHKLEKGVVVDKYTRAAYTTFVYSNKVMIPIYHPKSYIVELKGKVDGETITETFEIKKSEWDSIKIGDNLEVRDD